MSDQAGEEEGPAIVIDNGTKTTKAGFCTDNSVPKAEFPSIIGRPRHQGIMVGFATHDAYVGDEALAKCGILAYKCPAEHGIITNWDDMEKIWHHTFYNELRVAPEEHPVLLTEKVDNPKANREKLTQIMFETFNVPAMYLVNDAVLTVYSAAQTTGLAVITGEHICHTVPVHEGVAIRNATSSLRLGGSDLTDSLLELLAARGYSFTTTAEREIVVHIKNTHALLSPYTFSEEKSADNKPQEYELPDGQIITLDGEDMIKCCESLFDPGLHKWTWRATAHILTQMTDVPIDILSIMKLYCGVGLDPSFGLHEMCYNSIRKCDKDLQEELLSSITPSGGSSNFQNFNIRLKKEIQELCDKNEQLNRYKVAIKGAEMGGQYKVWRGGALFAKALGVNDWIAKEEYDEFGPMIVHRKCLN